MERIYGLRVLGVRVEWNCYVGDLKYLVGLSLGVDCELFVFYIRVLEFLVIVG